MTGDPTPLTVRLLLAEAWQVLRLGAWRLVAVYALCQAIVLLIVAPVLRWVFTEALHAAGLSAVDLSVLPRLLTSPLSAALILAIVAAAFVVMSLQLVIVVVMVQRVRRGQRLLDPDARHEIRAALRRLTRPSALPLLPYLFLLLPLAGFGFLSVLSQAIAIPSFITGELVKTAGGRMGYAVFLIALAFVMIRFALTIPLFATTSISGGRALALSWKTMRLRRATPTVVAAMIVLAGASLSGVVLLLVGVAPVVATDALAPDASPAVAAIMLAIVQVAAVVLVGMAVAMVLALLLKVSEGAVAPVESASAHKAITNPAQRRTRLLPGAIAVVIVIGLSLINLPLMNELARAPMTLVVAHRGDTTVSVENTIASLVAAREAGADIVEMDVMQTADGKFVVMHDANLARLAGQNVDVGSLRFDELTALRVHDEQGNSEPLPSLSEYVRTAAEIGQLLLIEIKLHGGETDDHVELLVEELERMDLLEANVYHSLDLDSVERLKRLRPGLGVGYTMALAGVGVPETSADFLVVEEWSYERDLFEQAKSAGLGLMVWTVNEDQTMRTLLRDDVDGIITDLPSEAVRVRSDMQDEIGFSDVLIDAIMRTVTFI